MDWLRSQPWFRAACIIAGILLVVGVIYLIAAASRGTDPQSAPAVSASATPATDSEEEQVRVAERPVLDTAVKKAEASLRTYGYQDTDATRKGRLGACGCVTDRFLADPSLNLGFGDSMADQGMIENKFKVKAGEITYLSGEFKDATTARVTYSVQLRRSTKDGPLPDLLIKSTSEWSKVSGQWRLDAVTPR